jgi:acyl carrier protein
MEIGQVKQAIKQAIVEGLKLRREPASIQDADPLFGGGLNLDSVDILTLVTVLEEKFNIKIEDDEVPALMSVKEIAAMVMKKQGLA